MPSRTGFSTLPFGAGPFGGVVAYPATFTLEQRDGGVLISVANPKPGDEWAILGNRIERRLATTGTWAVIGVAPENGSYLDVEAVAGVAYEYRVTPYQAVPTLVLIAAVQAFTWRPSGVVLYELGNPATVRAFPFKNGNASEKITVESVTRTFIGRARPVLDFGPAGSLILDKPIIIPFTSDHAAAVQWWRDRLYGYARLCLRDSRGRHVHGSLGGDLTIEDEKGGTSITFNFIETGAVV